MLVSDFNNGNIYDFKLNRERNALILNGSLAGKIAYNSKLAEPINWSDTGRNCDFTFRCIDNSTAGWQNIKTSFQLSTNTTKEGTWSWIYGKEIDVNPGEQYVFTTHMKLNNFVIGSHIKLQGYNETSQIWNEIMQCPSSVNRPLEWHEYSCKLTIPANIDKIRPILNAGWSSQPGKEAITLFDAIEVRKLSVPTFGIILGFADTKSANNLVSNPNFEMLSNPNVIRSIIFGQRFGYITDMQIGPDGYLYILSLNTDAPVYPGQIFPYYAPIKETIYRIVPRTIACTFESYC